MLSKAVGKLYGGGSLDEYFKGEEEEKVMRIEWTKYKR